MFSASTFDKHLKIRPWQLLVKDENTMFIIPVVWVSLQTNMHYIIVNENVFKWNDAF